MRIIGGSFKGMKIKMPLHIRPTRDFVREAVFNILGPKIQDKTVYDICAGSGAYGLEALSRGAKKVIFIEKSKENCAVIKANASVFSKGSYIIQPIHFEKIKFLEKESIIFFDPPYDEKNLYEKMFALEVVDSWLIMESDTPLTGNSFYTLWDQRRYGSTYIGIYRRQTKITTF